MTKLTLATRFEVKNGRIYLYDVAGNYVDGKNARWEGHFNCYNNELTSLAGAPLERQDMFPAFLAKGYVFADGILTELVSKKGNVFKTKRLGTGKVVYVVKDGSLYSHGDTLKKAHEDLAFKKMSGDVEQFRGMALTTKKTVAEWAKVYRAITRACEAGTADFISRQGKMKKFYTLKEILAITDGAYGSERFKEVVG